MADILLYFYINRTKRNIFEPIKKTDNTKQLNCNSVVVN